MNIRYIMIIFVGALLLFAVGCPGPEISDRWDEISTLKKECAALAAKAKGLEDRNAQLTEQVETLAKLEREFRFDMISTLDRITISKQTGFHDTDKDGTDDTIAVLLKTYDESGDVVKTAGDVNLQLWDLSKGPEEALICEWDVKANELKDMWIGRMSTNYYKLPYNIAGLLDKSQNKYTIKVKFVDYLTGKSFQEQRVISL